MKKFFSIRFLLLLLLLWGLLITAVGCSSGSAGEIVTKTHSITENFTSISVDCSKCNISLLPSGDNTVSVVCKEREKYPHSIFVKNGCLTVEEPSRTDLLNIFSLRGEHTQVEIYLPVSLGENCKLTLEAASGNIEIDKAFTFEEGDLSTASGNITSSSSFAGNLTVENASGDVLLSADSCGDIEVSNASGKITLKDIGEAKDIELESASGGILLNKVNCRNFDAEAASGKLTLEDVLVEKELSGETASGNISLLRCDAAEIDLETDSGNIEGSVLRPMHFVAESLSGRVNVPSTEGDICKLNSLSGNISITVE